jgi:tetratricopeptide (TPR) repeat protein
VHEKVEPNLKRKDMAIKECPIPIHHYGQLNKEKNMNKGEEYYRIGVKKLDEMKTVDPLAIYELAVQAGMLEKWDEAIGLWQRFVALQPNFPMAYVNMGTAYQEMGRYDAAIQAVQTAMKLDPQLKEAPADYGLYLLHTGKAKKAVDVLEDVVNRFPDFLSAWFKLGTACFCNKQKTKGKRAFGKLEQSELGPGLAVSCQTIAEKFFQLERFDYAIAVLEGAIACHASSQEIVALLNACREDPQVDRLSPKPFDKMESHSLTVPSQGV